MLNLKKIFIPFKISVYVLLLTFTSSNLYAQGEKKLAIKGLKLFSEEQLFSELKLNRFEQGKISLTEVISSIEKFYRRKNYTLVKIFATDLKTSGEYILFVDEGRIGKIIVHNLNNYYSLKFKQQINIPHRIYNTEIMNLTMSDLRDKFPLSDIKVEIQQPPDYEGNIIQLDRELQRLKLGEIIDLPFFEIYNPQYDLHFYVKKRNGNSDFDSKSEGIGYDINYKYPSVFIPEIYYYNENIFYSKDYLESSLTVGLDPGLKGFFSIPPSNTLLIPPKKKYVQLTGEYKISPMRNDFIGPLLRGLAYQSDTSRKDLGLTQYSYLNLRGTLAPEITLLKHLNIYAGIGIERVFVYNSKNDSSAENHYNPGEDFYQSSFAEARLKFDPIPIRIGNRIDKNIIVTYTDYFTGNSSNKLEIFGTYDTEFNNLSILSLKSKAVLIFRDPPFYMSEGINDQYFKGFSGDGYYSNREISLSGEYRFSIFQDFVYAGVFLDTVLFKPEGYILSGTKEGVICGPTGRFLIYDQFEFIVYFGFNRLFPDNKSGTDIQMRLRKKW